VETKSQEVVLNHPDLDHVHVWNRKQASRDFLNGRIGSAWSEVRRVIDEIHAVDYEVAIDFQNLLKSGFFAWQSGAGLRIGFSRLREANFLFTNLHIEVGPDARHMVRRYLKLLEPLNVSYSDHEPAIPIFVPPEKKSAVDSWFSTNVSSNRRVVALNPASSLARKRWPVERFAQTADRLADQLNVASILIWGPGEEQLVESVSRQMRTSALIAPPTTLKELAHLFSRCDLYLGNDTGPLHLAAAMDCSALGLFGPSDPERVGPWTTRAIAVAPPQPFSKRRRMEDITVDQVVAAASQLLEDRP